MPAINIYQGVYGLTGIIGSGKSTAAQEFTKLGAKVIDADALAKEVLTDKYKEFTAIKEQLVNAFAADLNREKLFESNQLNRQALASIVFNSDAKLNVLNQIIHPHVRSLFNEYRKYLHAEVIIYDVPLLFESDMQAELKATIVIYAPENIARKRAAKRMQVSEQEIQQRLNKQISIEEKRKMADYIIDNSTDISALKQQVASLYVKLATQG